MLEGDHEIATAPYWRAMGIVAAHNAIVERLEADICRLQERLNLCDLCSEVPSDPLVNADQPVHPVSPKEGGENLRV